MICQKAGMCEKKKKKSPGNNHIKRFVAGSNMSLSPDQRFILPSFPACAGTHHQRTSLSSNYVHILGKEKFPDDGLQSETLEE